MPTAQIVFNFHRRLDTMNDPLKCMLFISINPHVQSDGDGDGDGGACMVVHVA